MGRRRIGNKNLPKYWVEKHNAFYYKVPVEHQHLFDRKWVRLGSTLHDSYHKFATLPIHEGRISLIGEICDRYQQKVIPLKAPSTQQNNRRSMTEIRYSFGEWKPDQLRPHHVYQFFHMREEKSGRRSARADVELLRHVFTKAVEWGVVHRHPFKREVILPQNPPRNRYVTDEELSRFKIMCPPKIVAYINLKLITGLSKQDLLCIKKADIQEDGLHARRRKTSAKAKVYPWDEEGVLRATLDAVAAAHRRHIGSLHLFHNRKGKPYYEVDVNGHALGKPSGFNSIWQRLMKKWKDAGNEGFTEHDIRAKVASDAEAAHAQALMDHTTAEMTERVYRRKDVIVPIGKRED